MQTDSTTAKFDLSKGVSSLLFYVKYGRLMVLLFLLALMLGLAFYVYARAVYHSRGLVRFQFLELPVHAEDVQVRHRTRSLVERLRSRYMVERTALRLGLTNELGNFENIRDFHVQKVDVAMIDGATLRVDVYAFDPKVIMVWQQALVEEFTDYNRHILRERRERYLDLYKEELDQLAERITLEREGQISFEEENAITELFIEQSGLTQVPKDMILTRHRLNMMDRALEALESGDLDTVSQLSLLSTLENQAEVSIGALLPRPAGRRQETTMEGLLPIPDGSGEGQVIVLPGMVTGLEPWQELDKEYRRLEQQIKEASKTYLSGHRVMVGLQNELDRVKEALELELNVMLARFDLEYARLTDSLHKLEAQLPEYREVNRRYRAFRQQFEMEQHRQLAWDKAHEDLAELVTRTEYRGDVIPIDLEFLGFTLVRDDPVSPPKLKLVMMASALGLVLAFGVPFGLESLNNTAHRLDDLETKLRIPGLGVIPVYSSRDLENISRVPELDATKPDALMENFRIIRGSIALNRESPWPTQAIMITSARPREGKSTVALNLAWAFASMGEKTLVIDGDLRRGRLHRIAGIDNGLGLSTVLNRDRDWTKAVQTTGELNLDVLPRGPIIPGTTELLCRSAFDDLMNQFRASYDRVILDTPPILGLSETVSLQRVVDGVVMVTLAERTSVCDVEQACQSLRKSGARIYGFVLNALDLHKTANYYNYYYYSPHYHDALDESDEVQKT